MHIKTIEKINKFQGKILDLFIEKVTFPSHEVTMESIHHPGGAAVVPLFFDKTVMLIQQYRHCIGKTIWEIPAGRMNAGEDPRECAERELEEEVGCCAAHIQKLTAIYSAPAYCTELIHIFLAQDLMPGRQKLEDDELITVVKLPLAQAIEKVTVGEVRDAKTVVGLLLTWMRIL